MTIKQVEKSYFELTGKRLKNSSQLKGFNLIEDSDGTKFFNIFRAFNNRELDVRYFDIHELDYEDWWDFLSYKYYGTPYLWWVILLVNDIENPFEFPEAGTNIKILKKEYTFTILNEVKGLATK